ncbi:MAG: hypothetical protein H6568_12265 [Lewinellaceae bacterium]|nr:hypothetical protein [Saprospiraceae bacterium]MCB9313529.1 hypothetical protein [Lewinellaceae bacterium]
MDKTATTHPPCDPFVEYHVRPRFQAEVPLTLDEVVTRIRTGLQKENAPCQGKINRDFVTLHVPIDQQHYWSPQLTLSIEPTEGGSLLRGLYGPRPTVWTMFVFFYTAIGFSALIIGIVGMTNKMYDEPSNILWWLPVLVALFFSLYGVAWQGQKLGHEQMVQLHRFLEDHLGMRCA